MSRLILVRHSTPAVDPSLPRAEWPLSEDGVAHAAGLAEEIRLLRPAAIFTSPERKAYQTAELIVRALGIGPAHTVGDLREHDDGGAPFADDVTFRRAISDFFARPSERVFGAESAHEAHARFAAAIAALPRSQDGSSDVVVSHGRVLSLFMAHQRGVDAYEFWRKLTTPWFTVLDLTGLRER